MRLWHKKLIPYLPRLQLLSQWRECCLIFKLINEKGTPNHLLVNYVVEYPIEHFLEYSDIVAHEMFRRGYRVNLPSPLILAINNYRLGPNYRYAVDLDDIFFDHHRDQYLIECLYNLEEKYRCGGIPEEEWKMIFENFNWVTDLVD